MGPRQCPVRSSSTAGTAILSVPPMAQGRSAQGPFSSIVPLKRGEILLILGCSVCAKGKRWRSCHDLSVTGSEAGIWERMEGLNCLSPIVVAGGRGTVVAGTGGVPSLAVRDHDGSMLGCGQTWAWLHHPVSSAAR